MKRQLIFSLGKGPLSESNEGLARRLLRNLGRESEFDTLFGSDAKITQNERQRYRTATYAFPDGVKSAPSPFIGFALLKWLQKSRKTKIDRVIIIGTHSAMWDAFLEIPEIEAAIPDGRGIEIYDDFSERVRGESGGVDHNTPGIDELQAALEAHLDCEVRFKFIPFAIEENEQLQLLDSLAELCPEEGSKLILDVTHGFRHTPMLLLLSAFHLSFTRKVEVESIYYGALEMSRYRDDRCAPVIEMNLATSLYSWGKALGIAQSAGNFEPVADLLQPEAEQAAKYLKQASFLSGNNQVARATGLAKQFKKHLPPSHQLSGPSRLFRGALCEAVSWSAEKTFAKRQLHFAWSRFKNRDYLRATIAGVEAYITYHLPSGCDDPHNYTYREEAKESIRARLRNQPDEVDYAWEKLSQLRNPLAHGLEPRGRSGIIDGVLNDEMEMRNLIHEALTKIGEAIQ